MLRAFLLAVLLCGPAIALGGPLRPLDDVLAEADALRSSDRARSEALVAEVQRRSGTATPAQRDHLQLLLAYESAVAGRYTQAVEGARALHAQAATADLRFRAAILVANVAAVVRDHALGMRYLTLAFALEPKVRDRGLLDVGELVAATAYSEWGQPERALQHAERVLARKPDLRTRCLAEQTRSRAFALLAQGDAQAHERAVSACTAAREPLGVALAHVQHARWLLARKRPAEAIAVAEATRAAAEQVRYPRLTGDLYSVLASARLAVGNKAQAAEAARVVLMLDGQHPHWGPTREAHEVLYVLAERAGRHRDALLHFRALHAAQLAHLDEVRSREVAFLATRMDALSRERREQTLTHQNAAMRLQQQVDAEQRRTLRLTVALLALVVVLVAYWAWQYRRTHHRLRQLAHVDTLTGVASRAHFHAQAGAAIAACRARSRSVALLMLDIDHFKQVNDQCGHAVGDWVLHAVAKACQAACPADGLVGRIGGEEFALLLPGADERAAVALGEHIRARVRAIDPAEGGCHLPVSASVGVATSGAAGFDLAALSTAADQAMYAAKRAGRDKVATGPASGAHCAGPHGSALHVA